MDVRKRQLLYDLYQIGRKKRILRALQPIVAPQKGNENQNVWCNRGGFPILKTTKLLAVFPGKENYRYARKRRWEHI